MIRSVFRMRVRQDDGVAMITAILVIVVGTFLAATAMSLSIHNQDSSTVDRSRTQAIHAAEAGIDLTMQTISSSTQTNLPCTLSGSTTSSPSAAWAVTITYNSAYPPTTAGTLTCTAGSGPSATPTSAVVKSVGSVRMTGGYVNRTMQAQLKLSSSFGLLTNAIFSNSTSSINNQVTINGYQGEDADIYVNGNVDCPNQGTFHGSVYAQGTISISNSCYFAVDAWASGAVTMGNTATVNHDVKSGSSSLTMSNNSHVNRNAWVKTSCSGCSTRVSGTITTGGTGPGTPPTQTYPTWTYDAAKWTTAGYTVVNTTCAAAPGWLTNSANNGTKAVLRISSGCTLTLSGITMSRTADLAIFTNGPIVTGQNTTFQTGDSDYHIFYMISESGQTCTTNVSGAPGTIFMASSTGFVHLHFLVFAPCKVSFANNNSGSVGQIYGNPVSFASNLSYSYFPTEAVGMGTPTSFKSELSFEREIKN